LSCELTNQIVVATMNMETLRVALLKPSFSRYSNFSNGATWHRKDNNLAFSRGCVC